MFGTDECASGLQNAIDSMRPVEVHGSRTDVDDWDVWKVSVVDCCGGWDSCFDRFAEWFLDTYRPGDRVSFRSAFRRFLDHIRENADQMIDEYVKRDPSYLRRNGELVSRGGQWTSKSRFYS